MCFSLGVHEDAPGTMTTQETVLGLPTAADIRAIAALIAPLVQRETLLPRSDIDITERLRDYVVLRQGGRVVGAASLALVNGSLAEVGVLVAAAPADEDVLLGAVVGEARRLGAARVFVLTNTPEPYARMGFTPCSIHSLPEKRDRQCLRCSRAPRCRQQALALTLDN